MSTEYASPIALARGVMTGLQKARSNAIEAAGEILARELEPDLWDDGDMGLMKVVTKMTEQGDSLTASDVANLMYFVHRDEDTLFSVSLHPVMQGMEPFPTMLECLERWL